MLNVLGNAVREAVLGAETLVIVEEEGWIRETGAGEQSSVSGHDLVGAGELLFGV
jgi:hypothetical protein